MEKRKLNCVERANANPYKLNQIGKEGLAINIIEAMTEEELNNFLGEWGYEAN